MFPCRRVPWLTMTPRSWSSSFTSRWLNGNRWRYGFRALTAPPLRVKLPEPPNRSHFTCHMQHPSKNR